MSESPGGRLATRPLHFFFLVDCSGSMAGDGKIQALNNGIREAIPHLREVASENPFATMLVRSLAFSTGARWHIERPVEIGELRWPDLTAGGFTDLGAALRMLAAELRSPPMPGRALPPAIVLVSDGQPTDDFEAGLAAMLAEPWGRRAVRLAIAIGRDADLDALSAFIGHSEIKPLSANNPEQLVRMLRWASTAVSKIASVPTSGGADAWRPPIPHLVDQLPDEAGLTW